MQRVAALSEKTGINFRAGYAPQYGGWELYSVTENEHRTDEHNFSTNRMESKVFAYYLRGLIEGIHFAENK